MTTPEDAFQRLAGVFASRGNAILEIEIIPPSLGSPFLRDVCSIGITKKALVQAFTVARRLFVKHQASMTADALLASLLKPNMTPGEESDLVTTEIVLLFDCEHLTACNWRKRRLLAALTRRQNASNQTRELVQMFKTELTLLQSYQCSPLHRHTKSPTLWSHRLWVRKQLLQLELQSPQALLDLEREELDVVLRAAALHPKNYYAFTYMRQIHALLASTATSAKGHPSWAGELARVLLDPVLDWCLARPRDISGWTFEIYLLGHVSEQSARSETVGRVLRFARDIGWEGESLWTFIDQAVRQFGLESVVDETFLHDTEQAPHVPAPASTTVDQQPPPKWPWRARLARARAYWAVYGHGHGPGHDT
ncbi:uncharacterized protein N7482_002270 [Penicillium canariense]|uniref:Protein prenyltransferase n=1 Tax=Penicillium canariense TaxID=189055 RepID=A0A9W9IEY5_9EURO|nr:uncharacterized protein N7482_002270 [Penicillium canariense]KAJ5176393.1 hypothetical protein N7482_002270 [Penicillium canariense]